jgi:hypothetical protein
MKTAVLGAGPTGLLAAQELYARGHEVTVFTDEVKPAPQGAFYYHNLPDSLKSMHSAKLITHRYRGSGKYYQRKQWGFEYASSFPSEPVLLQTDRRFAWWPTRRLHTDLSVGLTYKIGAVNPDTVGDIYTEHDFVVQTFPTQHLPDSYLTPTAVIPLSMFVRLCDEPLFPNELFYNGLSSGYNESIVRVATPEPAFTEGRCFVELTRTYRLPSHWNLPIQYIPDLHPYQASLIQAYTLPDHVLLAGRFTTGNPRYLTHHVLEDIAVRLDGDNDA